MLLVLVKCIFIVFIMLMLWIQSAWSSQNDNNPNCHTLMAMLYQKPSFWHMHIAIYCQPLTTKAVDSLHSKNQQMWKPVIIKPRFWMQGALSMFYPCRQGLSSSWYGMRSIICYNSASVFSLSICCSGPSSVRQTAV